MPKILTVATVLGITLAATAPASAGGYVTLFDKRRFFKPGERVNLTSSIFSDKPAAREEGTYSVYLLRQRARWWRGDSAQKGILVGSVEAIAIGPRTLRTTSRFTLPQNLDSGYYMLEVCGRSCRDWLGALGPTPVGIATTPVEARMLRRLERLEARLQAVKFQASRKGMSYDVDVLTQPLSEVVYALEDETESSTKEVQARMDKLQDHLRSLEATWYREPIALLGAALLLAMIAASLGGLLTTRSRRGAAEKVGGRPAPVA